MGAYQDDEHPFLRQEMSILEQALVRGFDLPAEAVLLAQSGTYDNQAFRVGRHVWGFQFHLEADPAWSMRGCGTPPAADFPAARVVGEAQAEQAIAAQPSISGDSGSAPITVAP
jgi:GMP synthase-like glutamine amidotransferase